eukprot:scaffold1659_cov255-Pinguiococcus_pyrenoidosus.AAC.29
MRKAVSEMPMGSNTKPFSRTFDSDEDDPKIYIRKPLKKNRHSEGDKDGDSRMSADDIAKRKRKASSVERLFNGPLPTMAPPSPSHMHWLAQQGRLPEKRRLQVKLSIALPPRVSTAWEKLTFACLFPSRSFISGGFGGSNEQRRFFVLRFGLFYYYKNEADFQRDIEPTGAATFNITECTVYPLPDEGDAVFVIEPITSRGGQDAVRLRADNETQMQEWLEAFEASGARPKLG